jgi:cobalt-zinc-cadmium efflux system protein
MLSDAIALGLAAFTVTLSSRKATKEKTYGFKRFEILAAVANGLILVLLSLGICFQAIFRFLHPLPVDAKNLIWVAALGLVVNLAMTWILHRGEEEKTINEQGALLHVLGDLGASLAAIGAGILILWKGWVWADPALSLVISFVIIIAGIRLMLRTGNILAEGTPEGIDIEGIRNLILQNQQVQGMHDLHLWTLNGQDLFLSAHIEIIPGDGVGKAVLSDLTQALTDNFKVSHLTLQIGQCLEMDCLNKC